MSVATATAMPLTRRAWFIRSLQVFVIAAFVGVWEGLGQLGILDKFFYSRPSLIVPRIWGWLAEGYTPTSIYRDIEVTLIETVLGFVIGTLLGVAIGYAFARNRVLGQAFDPLLSMFNAIPRLVLAPVFILAFGIDLASKVALGVTLVFFIVLFATFTAVRVVDQTPGDSVRVLGARCRAECAGHQAAPGDGQGLGRLGRLAHLPAVGPREGPQLLRGREPGRPAELRRGRHGRRDGAPLGFRRLHGQLAGPLDQGADRGQADEDGRLVREAARHGAHRAQRSE